MMAVMATEPLGTKIAKRRQQLRLSQQDLADRLGVNRTSVANWERGKSYPQRHLGRLEEVLGIRLDGETGTPDFDPDDADEARIMSWTDLPLSERQEMVNKLRTARRDAPARDARNTG